jgi:hypothetical protein
MTIKKFQLLKIFLYATPVLYQSHCVSMNFQRDKQHAEKSHHENPLDRCYCLLENCGKICTSLPELFNHFKDDHALVFFLGKPQQEEIVQEDVTLHRSESPTPSKIIKWTRVSPIPYNSPPSPSKKLRTSFCPQNDTKAHSYWGFSAHMKKCHFDERTQQFSCPVPTCKKKFTFNHQCMGHLSADHELFSIEKTRLIAYDPILTRNRRRPSHMPKSIGLDNTARNN